MQRKSATAGLIVEASCVLQETVGVLSESERGVAMRALGTAPMSLASYKTRVAISRSEFVIAP